MQLKTKVLGIVAAFALVVSGTSVAGALTVEQLKALGLTDAQAAAIAAILGGTTTTGTTTSMTFTRDLTIGSTGADVVALQDILISGGYLVMPVGVSKGYFGPLTQSAVSRWQAAVGISPTAGYFGPISRARVNATTTTTTTTETTTTTTTLQGGEGYLDEDVITDGSISIDLGDSETVIEVDFEAKDSDVEVNRVDFMFNERPWLYFDEVNLLVDGKEVGSLSRQSDFSEVGNNYRARFSGVNSVIREDDTATFALELVVLESMAGSRASTTVTVTLPQDGVRFTDGAGLTDYAPAAAVVATVDFDDTFGQGDIKLSIGDNSPEAAQIVLNKTSRTNNVTVLEFNVEAEDSDVEIKDVSVTFAVATNTVGNVLHRAYLYRGNTMLKQSSVSGATTTFTGVDYTVDADDEETFTVRVDFNRGDTLILPTTFTVANVVVMGEDADFVAVNETLTVTEAHTILVDGAVISSNNTTATSFNNDTTPGSSYGEYRIEFEVSAVGEDIFIPLTAVRNASTTAGAAFQIEDANGTVVTSDGTTTQSLARVSGGTLVSGNYVRINKGSTATFRLVATYNPAASAGQYRAQLLTAAFNPSSAATPTVPVNAIPEVDFETANILIQN
jgi:peptidoglycan hydrolase-like protein with peptidoglycan-binding domain